MAFIMSCLFVVAAVLSLGLSAWADPGADAWGAFLAGDPKKAFELARPAAEAGNMSAQALLGYLYWTGNQAPKDQSQANAWFKKYGDQSKELAAKGDQSGEHGLGWLYENGWGGFKQDYAESAKWYRKASDQGNQHSQVQLGSLYQRGLGVKQDYVEAAGWFRKSADQGNRYAQFNLGWFYQNGLGVKQDYAEAARFYRLAADVGEPSAEHALACLYFFGLGVKQDYAEAAALWRKADEAGSPYAPWGLGSLCRGGLGGFSKDYGQALQWFRKGVERGDLSYSGASLGLAYENGEGVVQDFVEAYKWYLLSSARDNASGREGMNRLRQSMTKEQVAEAQKQASALEASLAGKPAAPAAPDAAVPVPAKVLVSDVDAPSFRLKEDPRRFALVVGIDGYKDLPAASHAERDADAVRRTLVSMGYPERNVVELKGPEATIAGLRKYLDEWLPRNAKSGSTVFFYFSGHGAPDAEDGASYLVPWDGDASYLKSTAYPVKDVYSGLARLKANSVIVALDACFSGAGGRSVMAKGARPLVVKGEAAAVPGKLAVFAAASGEQITSTLEDQGHGTFTYYFLKGLGGGAKDAKGRVTTTSLLDYLKPKVQDAARRQNREQEPSLRGQADQELVRF